MASESSEYGYLSRDVWTSIFSFFPTKELLPLKRINKKFQIFISAREERELEHLLMKTIAKQELTQPESELLVSLLVSKTKRSGTGFLQGLVEVHIEFLDQSQGNLHRLKDANRLLTALRNPTVSFFPARRTSSVFLPHIVSKSMSLLDVYYEAYKKVLLSLQEIKRGKENKKPDLKRQKTDSASPIQSLSPTQPLSLSRTPTLSLGSQK